MTTATQAELGLSCGVARPDGGTCGHDGCWRACWTCSQEGAELLVAARLDVELDPGDFEAIVQVQWHDVVWHRYDGDDARWDCEIAAATYEKRRLAEAAQLAAVPDDGQPRPFTLTSTMIHRADCAVVLGRGTFWRQHLTSDEAMSVMQRKGGGKLYARCSQCAPDVPEARRLTARQSKLKRGAHFRSGVGWPDAMPNGGRLKR